MAGTLGPITVDDPPAVSLTPEAEAGISGAALET
jgi:hypothetical protein